MRAVAVCVLVGSLGCASTSPFVVSAEQRKQFEDVVRDAEAAGAADGPSLAAQRLAEARSEFEYSQRLPLYPERARLLAAKAQTDAQAALDLIREQAQARTATPARTRDDVLAGAATP